MATSVDLLAKIESFEIDGPDAPDLTFAARLAREQGWTVAFARRAIREYKLFVYLAITAHHIACPSEQVDAVWHQHLTYTRAGIGRAIARTELARNRCGNGFGRTSDIVLTHTNASSQNVKRDLT